MQAEQPRTTARPSIRRWIWLAGLILFGLIAAGIGLLAVKWPFTRAEITKALEEASGRPVQIATFTRSYFPPGCVAEKIRFLRHRNSQGPPLITVEKLMIQGSLTGLFGATKHLSAVRVIGMRVAIPSDKEEGETGKLELNAGPGSKSLAISKITADGTTLEFHRDGKNEEPFVLKIEHLQIRDVGAGTPMLYQVTLTNTEPPGVIRAEGKFGPWNPSDVGATPVSGTYSYDNIELSRFKSIFGVGQARGRFSGPLSRIETSGTVAVPSFRVEGSNHHVDLATSYQATVNGTNGDVHLHPATARFRRTRLEVQGWIAARAGEKGKSASFDLAIPAGRVDDLLYLFTRDEPGMSGNVSLSGKFLWPPGPSKFLEKIRMDLGFGMPASRFTSPNTQGSIDRLTESALHEKINEDDNLETVFSKIRGRIQVRDGLAVISDGSLELPGTHAAIQGSYNLLDKRVDLHGTLDTQGSLSKTSKGFKAALIKVVTPLLPKRSGRRIVPFHITGSYGDTSVGIDWKRNLSRSR